MKVAIDVSPLKNANFYRGVGTYTNQLIESFKLLKIRDFSFQLIESRKEIKNCDLIHYPFFDLFFLTLPLRKIRPTLVTIHDVIPLVFPENYPPGLRGLFKFQIQKMSLKGVKAVITDSENSKRDIFKYLNYPLEKIFVVPLAPSPIFKPLKSTMILHSIIVKYKLPEKFVLYVGDVNYNKNVTGLIKAFHKLKNQNSKVKDRNQNLKLVLVGKAFLEKDLKETKKILQLIKSLKLTEEIIRIGWVPSKDLVGIYNLATVYCQPSFYEGFGLPVLEAMACGCPVVSSKVSSLPEICDKAAIMVDPYNINDIVKGISKVLNYDTAQYHSQVERGLSWVRNFSWEKTARQTYKIYQKVYKNLPKGI